MLLGENVNCQLGEELTFRIKTPGWENLQIACNGKLVATLPLSGEAQFMTYTPAECGDHSALCVKNGATSKAAEFTVVCCQAATEKSVYAPNETITVTASDGSGTKPISIALMVTATSDTVLMRNLTPEEQETGKFTLSYDAPGEYHLRIFFRNQNGFYRTDRKSLTITE